MPASDASVLRSRAQSLARANQFNDAIHAYLQAVSFAPNDASLHLEFGSLAGQLGLTDLALHHLGRAVMLDPQNPATHNDLGQTYCQARDIPAALTCFSRAIAARSDYLPAANNFVYYAHFAEGYDGHTIRRFATDWAARHAESLTLLAPRHDDVDRSPTRRLRIGFVSPDLYEHPVGRFMLPILANHDRAEFEITAYSDNAAPDAFSATLRSHCERWRETAAMPDETLAQQTRGDKIDILIDLSLHMGGSRLLAFARKPAPVQVTYLAYASTSGMSAMDWRFSDPHLDPPGNDSFYTERTLRLASSYWCYIPPAEAIDVTPRQSGPITFACTNNVFKVTDTTLRAWATILAAVPSSRLLLHSQAGRHTDQILRLLNVDRTRVVFVPFVPFKTYLAAYAHMDILLDPFPYAGGTTTCDAMWMGVPVVTLAGQTAVQRGGVSLLRNVGLPELIAHDVDQYIAIATELANSPQRLAELRSTLRGRMESSILMNAPAFVRDFESALRQIWRDHVLSPR